MSEGQTYTEHIKRFESTLDKFEGVLERQAKDLSDIKQALLGSKFGENGIVKRLEIAENEVRDLKGFKDRIVWITIGVGSGSGAGVFAILKLIFNI
jgi:hypothetical protein